MILKGGSVGGGGLATHLRSEDNEAVDLLTADGVFSRDIAGTVAELRARAVGISGKGLIHIAISAAPGEKWGEAEQRRAIAATVAEYRLEGVPLMVVRHSKDAQSVGRDDHLHLIASRIDQRDRVISDSFSHVRNEKIARILEHDLGHKLTVGRHNRAVMNALRKEGRADVADFMDAAQAGEAPRPTAILSHAEGQQQKRTHFSKATAAAEVLTAFRASDCAAAFQAALADQGYRLARGREAGAVMVVDPAGGSHELTRLLRSAFKAEGDKQSAAQVRAQIDVRLSDLDRDNLPDIAAAVAATREGSQPDPDAPASAQAIAEEAPQEIPTAAAVLERLTWEKATFTEADLDRALKPINDQNARATLRAEILVRPDLLTVALDDGDRRMTIVSMARIEGRILDAGETMASRHRFAVGKQDVEAGLAAYMEEFRQQTGHEVNAEQIAAVRHVTGGADIAAVTGLAGAGKSTMMAGAARIWDSAGFKVEGCALSAVAAAKLAESGIASDTIASRLYRWDRATLAAELRQSGRFSNDSRAAVLAALNGWKDAAEKRGEKTDAIANKISQVEKTARLDDLNRSTRKWLNGWCDRQAKNGMDARTVLVIDEAGMVNHRLMARVLDHAERAGAKVVAIGDAEQIQPIEAGAAFRILTRAVGAAELKEVIRQREGWQRTATQHLAAASPERAAQAVRTYADHGCIHVGIRSMSNIETLCREAEAALGHALDDGEREQITRVSAYVAARHEAGALWAEIKENPQGHELADDFKAAQMARNASVQALASDIDAARPWLARYSVDSEGFAADLAFAEGQRRAAAEALAPDRAEAMGLTDLKADVKLHLSGREGARDALFQDWKADLLRDGMSTSRLILAYTRDDVAVLNGQARAIMREAGHLSGPDHLIQTEDGPLSVAVGDRIMTLANHKTLGVQNGMTGRVVGIEDRDSGAVLTIRADDGREVRIDTATYKNMQHSYACTLHKAQGVTVDRTWLLHHRLMDRHLAYVGMSRHRESVRLYAAAADAVSVDQLARQLGRGRTKDAIADYIDPRRLVQGPGEELGRIRQSIGQLSTTIRDLGRRLDAGLRRTFSTTQQKEKSFVRAIHAVRPGKSPTIRQPDVIPAISRPTARTDRLPQVPRLVLARDSGGSALLLSRHAADQFQQFRAGIADRLRRSSSADRAVTQTTKEGVNIMAATAGVRPRTQLNKETQQELDRFKRLSESPTATTDERQKLAQEIIQLATTGATDEDAKWEALSEAVGEDDATDLFQAAGLEHRDQINAHNPNPDQRRTRYDDLRAWTDLEARHPESIKRVTSYQSHVEIELKSGEVLRDFGDRVSVTRNNMTIHAVQAIAQAAEKKGWAAAYVSGTDGSKKLIAEAMTARGIKVLNPELRDFVKSLDRAHDIAADRAALCEARLKPDLANPQKFAEELSKYEHVIVNNAPDQALRQMRADLMARGEALQAHPAMGETARSWAEEAATAEAAEAVQEAVYTA